MERLTKMLAAGEGLAELGARLEGLEQDVGILLQTQNDTEVRLSRMEERLRSALTGFYGPPPPRGDGGETGMMPGTEGAGPGPEEGTAHTEPAPEGVESGGTEVAPTTPSVDLPVDPVELYQTAYADFARGNYELAILGFQEYQDRYADSEFADDAQYWIGEAYYSMERYPDSVQAFQATMDRYPEGDKVPNSMLKKGYALFEMNRIVEGIRELQLLVRKYPDSSAARLARQRLQGMGLATP
jgi:tol-pal system protein YbgF